MIFPFEVKKNGVYYPAGTEVPTGSKKGAEKPLSLQPGKVDTKIQKESAVKESVKEKERKYSEDDLNLPYMKLKSLAIAEGFKVEKSAKADEIKEMLRSL